MTLSQNSFTGDVMSLMACRGKDEAVKILSMVDDQPLDEFIRDGLVMSLCPYMEKTPDFVKQIVARALLEHVDWQHVANWIRSENN